MTRVSSRLSVNPPTTPKNAQSECGTDPFTCVVAKFISWSPVRVEYAAGRVPPNCWFLPQSSLDRVRMTLQSLGSVPVKEFLASSNTDSRLSLDQPVRDRGPLSELSDRESSESVVGKRFGSNGPEIALYSARK